MMENKVKGKRSASDQPADATVGKPAKKAKLSKSESAKPVEIATTTTTAAAAALSSDVQAGDNKKKEKRQRQALVVNVETTKETAAQLSRGEQQTALKPGSAPAASTTSTAVAMPGQKKRLKPRWEKKPADPNAPADAEGDHSPAQRAAAPLGKPATATATAPAKAASASAAEPVETEIGGQKAAMEYLRQWETDRANWKFKKVRQTFLLQHLFDPIAVSKENFKTLLHYLESLSGHARESTAQKAKDLFEGAPEPLPDDASWTEEQRAEAHKNALKLRSVYQHRARKVMQVLG